MKSGLTTFQAIMLSLFGVVAVVAIGIFAFLSTYGGGSSVGRVVIWGTLDESAFTTTIRVLAEDDTRFSQVVYVQKDSRTYDAELSEALASGAGPDLFILRDDYARRHAGKITPFTEGLLSAKQFEDSFIDGAESLKTTNGILGVPFAVDPLILYWNRDMLAASGIANPPAFWDEVYPLSTTLTERSSTNSIIKSAIAFGEFQNVSFAKEILSTLILQAGGAITATDSTGRLIPALAGRTSTGQDAQSASQSALRFFIDFADPAKDFYSWNRALPQSRSAFAAGDLALYVGLASETTLISRLNPNLNFSVAPLPQIRGRDVLIDGGYIYSLAISRSSANKGGANTIAFLIAGSDFSRYLTQALGMAPARRDLLAESSTGDSILFKRQALIVRSWIDPDPDRTDGIFRAMIEDATSGALRINEAIQRADQEMAVILDI